MNLGLKLDDVREEVLNLLGHGMESGEGGERGGRAGAGGERGEASGTSKGSKSKTPALDSFGRDLTELAKQNKLDPVIAQRIKELCLGLNGERRHSWRVLAMKVTGYECQLTGSDLESIAQWTLGENWDDLQESDDEDSDHGTTA